MTLKDELSKPLIQRAAAALELRRRFEEERLRYYQRPKVHKKQREVNSSNKRFRAVLGGNRSGKSYVGSVETVLFALGKYAEPYIQSWLPEDQEWWYRRFGSMDVSRREQVWVATINWDVHRQVTQDLILLWLPKGEIADIAYRRKGVIEWIQTKSGRRIEFKSYETGRDGFQGASLPFIWFDEEPPYDIWNEGEKRVMDQKGHILLTFTPLSGISWSHDRLYINSRNDPETQSWHFTWDDNPYLDEAEKKRLLSQMPEDEIQARVYGHYLVSGGTVFNKAVLLELRKRLKPGHRRPVEGLDFHAEVEVWEAPEPEGVYVIGADPAEGLQSGDNSAACVLDQRTGRQVAEFASNQYNAKDFAKILSALGRWYNNALIVPERNNDGKVIVADLLEMGYPNLYLHHDDGRWGMPTTSKTRPLLVALGQEVLKDAPETLSSPFLVDECLTFTRDARGRPQASGKGQRGGAKDDRIFAWLLALWGRNWFGPVPMPVTVTPKSDGTYLDRWIRGDFDGDKDREEGAYAKWDPKAWVHF